MEVNISRTHSGELTATFLTETMSWGINELMGIGQMPPAQLVEQQKKKKKTGILAGIVLTQRTTAGTTKCGMNIMQDVAKTRE